jgi:hypothetical protein
MTFIKPQSLMLEVANIRAIKEVRCQLPIDSYLAPQFFLKMAEAKKQHVAPKAPALFTRENYKWMLIGFVVIIIGLIFMIGGKSNDPNQFNVNEVYSFRRITLAPIVLLAGFAIEIYAIFRKPKKG